MPSNVHHHRRITQCQRFLNFLRPARWGPAALRDDHTCRDNCLRDGLRRLTNIPRNSHMSSQCQRIAHTGVKLKFVFVTGGRPRGFLFSPPGNFHSHLRLSVCSEVEEGKLLRAQAASFALLFRLWLFPLLACLAKSIRHGHVVVIVFTSYLFCCSFWNSVLHVSHCDKCTTMGRCDPSWTLPVGSMDVQALTYRIQIPPLNETSSVIYVLSIHAYLYGNGQRNKNKNAHAKQALVK